MDTRSQAVAFATSIRQQQTRQVGALPLLWPIVEEMGLVEHTNRSVRSRAQIDVGRVLALLTVGRLMAPEPLDGVADWLAGTVLPEWLAVDPTQVYDTRLERAFDALHPVRKALWQAVVTQAVLRLGVDLSFIHWDVTSFYFEGAYGDNSGLIAYGYSRDGRPDAKQAILGVDVTGREQVPLQYALLAGSTADCTTPGDNMDMLLGFFRQATIQARLAQKPVIVSDSKMLSPEVMMRYHDAGLYYLGPLAAQRVTEDLIRSVSAEELRAHPLAYHPRRRFPRAHPFVPYCGVWRPIEIESHHRQQTDRALVVWSAGKEQLDQKKRKDCLKRLLNALHSLQQKLNRGRYKRYASTLERIHTVQRGNPAQGLVAVTLSGTDGALVLHFRIDRDKLAAAQQLDGTYVLATNHPHLSADDALAHFKAQDGVEKRLAVVKGPLRVRPVFLHKDERIDVLVLVNMLALLLYAILELLVRRAGLPYTARKALKAFAPLGASYTDFVDGSHLRKADPLSPLQHQLLSALQFPEVSRYVEDAVLLSHRN